MVADHYDELLEVESRRLAQAPGRAARAPTPADERPSKRRKEQGAKLCSTSAMTKVATTPPCPGLRPLRRPRRLTLRRWRRRLVMKPDEAL
eukprot:4159766-Pleurochrysis_carterae.AAC.1